MSATQCEICGELLDCPENDIGDGESLGVALPRPHREALGRYPLFYRGAVRGVDVTDHDEEPVLRESIGERSRRSRS